MPINAFVDSLSMGPIGCLIGIINDKNQKATNDIKENFSLPYVPTGTSAVDKFILVTKEPRHFTFI